MAPDKAPFAEITAHTNEVWEPNFQLPFQGGSLPQAQHHHHTLVWIWRAGGGQLLCGPGVTAQGLRWQCSEPGSAPHQGWHSRVSPLCRQQAGAGQTPAGAPRARGSRTARCPAQLGTGTHGGQGAAGPHQAGHSPGQGAAVALVKPAWDRNTRPRHPCPSSCGSRHTNGIKNHLLN